MDEQSIFDHWAECMGKKIVDTYGEGAKHCIEGFGQGDIKQIAFCIFSTLGNTKTSPAAIAALLSQWSLECII